MLRSPRLTRRSPAVLLPTLLLASLVPAVHAATPAAPRPPGDPRVATDLDRRLDDARERLEAAAREVADLSLRMLREDRGPLRAPGRPSVLGLQLGPPAGHAGPEVVAVSPGGPAATAGIRPGDVLVAIDGRPVADAARVVESLATRPPGTVVKVDLDRAGRRESVQVTTRAARPVELAELDTLVLPDGPAFAGALGALRWAPWSELELAKLSRDLGKYFGTERGVLVVHAPSDSALKLRDGDVITAIDGREPTSGSQALRILRSYAPGEPIRFAVWRERKPLTLEAVAPSTDWRVPVAPPVPARAPAPAARPEPPPAAPGG
jgi:membrane-associated protease RseP (regulator of RpoE activity)